MESTDEEENADGDEGIRGMVEMQEEGLQIMWLEGTTAASNKERLKARPKDGPKVASKNNKKKSCKEGDLGKLDFVEQPKLRQKNLWRKATQAFDAFFYRRQEDDMERSEARWESWKPNRRGDKGTRKGRRLRSKEA